MASVCAPNVKYNFSCFEIGELEEIAKAFNKYIQKNNVCKNKNVCVPRKLIDIGSKSKKELWTSIYKRLNKICRYEYCWIDQEFINVIDDKDLREKIHYFTFKPKMTKDPFGWLSTEDINKVMSQYQELYESFYFVGALPCDFYDHTKMNYKEILKYKRVGIVFNLDTHDKSGSHWVAFLIDNDINTIEYFDSAAKSPNKHIKKFIAMVKEKTGKKYNYLQNDIVHQKKNGECGVYASYYIIQRLRGKTFYQIKNKVVNDAKMNVYRRTIFRPYG